MKQNQMDASTAKKMGLFLVVMLLGTNTGRADWFSDQAAAAKKTVTKVGTAAITTAKKKAIAPIASVAFEALPEKDKKTLNNNNRSDQYKRALAIQDNNEMNRLLTLCHGWDALDAESKKIIDTVMGCKDKFFDAPARLLESMKASASFLRTKQQYFIQGKGWKDVYPGAVIAKALMSNSDTSKFLMLENDDARKAKLTIVVNWINDQEATDPEFNVARDWLALPVNTQGNIIKAKLDFNYLATDPIDTKNERPGIVEAANALANIQ